MTAVEPAGTAGTEPAAGPRPDEAAEEAVTEAAQPEQPQQPEVWLPWSGKARKRDIFCIVGIMLSGFYGLAMIPFTPKLINTHPVLLELLAGSNSSTVAGGAFAAVQGKLEFGVVIAAALIGMMKFDFLFWWAGNMWGHRILTMFAGRSRRALKFAKRAERLSPKWAAVAVLLSAFLPVPTPLIYAAAGLAGLPLAWFLICDIIGTAAWATLLATLGYVLGPTGVTAANLVSRYALITILVLVALTVVPHAWHVIRSRTPARPAVDGETPVPAADLVTVRAQPDSVP
jgi:membrane protein DedA with SNARE-associated domain